MNFNLNVILKYFEQKIVIYELKRNYRFLAILYFDYILCVFIQFIDFF